MVLVDTSAITLSGLGQAQMQFSKAASRFAAPPATSVDGSAPDSADLSANAVALLSAKDQFSVDLRTLKVADNLEKSVLSLVG